MRGGDVHALSRISLDIGEGELLSIVGSSGSGKSTMLYVLGALIETTHGTYQFRGKRVDQMADGERAALRGRDIGFIFQSFHLVPQLNVVNNVLLSARYLSGQSRSDLKKRALELIERVGLGDRRRHRPIELSGGEMQRVAIARALLTKPSVVLADEPTGNLDETNRNEIFELLKTLNQEDGTTVIMVTHDLELAGRAPRQIRLRNGEMQNEAA